MLVTVTVTVTRRFLLLTFKLLLNYTLRATVIAQLNRSWTHVFYQRWCLGTTGRGGCVHRQAGWQPGPPMGQGRERRDAVTMTQAQACPGG